MSIKATAVCVLLLGVASVSSRARADDAPTSDKALTACTEVHAEVAYENLGYTHTVVLTNHCKKPVTCEITTNANPEPVSVSLDPDETHSIVTFRGSPAREFTPTVHCHKHQ